MSAVHVRVRAGGEDYALPVEWVTEVGEMGDITPVPGAASEVLGVRNLRGQVIPVVDLATILGIEGEGDGRERIVVAEDGERRAGFAVQSVHGVEELPEASEEAESEFVSGAVLVDGTLVGVIKVEALLKALAGSESP